MESWNRSTLTLTPVHELVSKDCPPRFVWAATCADRVRPSFLGLNMDARQKRMNRQRTTILEPRTNPQ